MSGSYCCAIVILFAFACHGICKSSSGSSIFVAAFSSSIPKPKTQQPPFQLQRIDHIVLRCRNFESMLNFYTNVLGCTIDDPVNDIGRFDGVLSHLRAGDAYIDLISYDETVVTSQKGMEVLLKMHAGGKGLPATTSMSEIDFSSTTSTLDHLCIRVNPFDEDAIREHLSNHNILVLSSGQRKGAEGVGPSVYIQDPEGNVVELKGPSSK